MTLEYPSHAPVPVSSWPRLSPHLLLPTKTPDYLRLILTSRVYEIIKETPLVHAPNLSAKFGNQIYLKREDLHEVFSFKIRGAYNFMASLGEEERWKGVVTCSAGNHAQGVALSGARLGIPCTIVMPQGTPTIKVRNVARLGAKVAKAECARLATTHGLVFVPPYDDPLVIAGQGTVGMEILKQIRVLGAETFDGDAMARSLDKGERVLLSEVGPFSDGTAVRIVGEEPFRICQKLLDGVVKTRSVTEPAGALALAGLKRYILDNQLIGAEKKFVVVVSGANMNFDRLRFVAERAALGEGREALLSIDIPERPGSFFALHTVIHPRSVTEFVYRYNTPGRAHVFLSFQLETTSRAKEVETVLAELQRGGMAGYDISDDEMAKSHARHMIGGASDAPNERIFRFEFPERPGALRKFLSSLRNMGWNISLFHYRNQGGDLGRVLAGIQAPEEDSEQFAVFLSELGYPYVEETHNEVYKRYLRK
ncbi:tryptophan synthase beta subunit-like PLP-dependent enzyme [Lactarius hengduanensis]|nr:tryptophan synthase beta subunit-like PLP-dependent enzyme [Lactarius hengduanensis]